MPSERNPFSRKQKSIKTPNNNKITNNKNTNNFGSQKNNKQHLLDKIREQEKKNKDKE